MRLLMLQQPWLNLVAMKYKWMETRMWKNNVTYRGEILLAASQKPQTLAQVKSIMTPEQFHKFLEIKQKLTYDIFGPCGIAGCVVNMVDYRQMNALEDVKASFVSYHPARKVLCFDKIQPVVSFPVKGMLGLLKCPPEYESQINFG